MESRISAAPDVLEDNSELSKQLAGCLSVREAKFLSLVATTMPISLGEVLEIGSFKGKSTTLLARSVQSIGGERIVAVDPLSQSCGTDPDLEEGVRLPEVFRQTLRDNNVESLVEFHQLRSDELVTNWTRALRFLWIDGDHTYEGASSDVENFAPFLQPGSIIALHDVLHPSEGPIRAFCEQVLLSSEYGVCGVCGSIGWAQYLGPDNRHDAYKRAKLKLFRRLSRLIPFVAYGCAPRSVNPFGYRLRRPFVPHGDINVTRWKKDIGKHLPAARTFS